MVGRGMFCHTRIIFCNMISRISQSNGEGRHIKNKTKHTHTHTPLQKNIILSRNRDGTSNVRGRLCPDHTDPWSGEAFHLLWMPYLERILVSWMEGSKNELLYGV